MRNIRKPSAILAAVFIAIILSSCATNRSFFDTRPYEETEEEKAIQYPFKVFGWYKNKLIEMEFRDKSNLIVSFPRIGGAKKVYYKYQMYSTLYSWKKGHSDMQLCGIELKVICAQEKPYYGFDWLTLCRKGDFSKPISDPMNYTDRRTRNKMAMMDFFGDNLTYKKIEKGDFDMSYSALPIIRFQRMDEEIRQERQRRREYQRTGGNTSIRRKY